LPLGARAGGKLDGGLVGDLDPEFRHPPLEPVAVGSLNLGKPIEHGGATRI
jgi:hypothetical protein